MTNPDTEFETMLLRIALKQEVTIAMLRLEIQALRRKLVGCNPDPPASWKSSWAVKQEGSR